MRLRSHPLSRIERIASLAMAIGVTVGTALFFLAAPGRFIIGPVRATADEVTVEHLVYVAPAPTLSVPPRRPVARSSVRPESRGANASPALEQTAAQDSATPAADATAPLATSAPPAGDATISKPSPSRSTAGAPIASAKVGFTHGPVEGVAPPPFKPLPPTQAEIDAKWRDEAFEVAAARGAGQPVRTKMAGGSVSVPLPFGGPSKKQRERDRAIEAELKVMRALRQQRIDSVVAARKRRLADSLARVTDSLRSGNQPQP